MNTTTAHDAVMLTAVFVYADETETVFVL